AQHARGDAAAGDRLHHRDAATPGLGGRITGRLRGAPEQRTIFGILQPGGSMSSSAAPFPTGQLADGKPRSILFDATACIGCRQCVQACKDWNDLPRTSLYELSDSTWITMEPPVLDGLSPVWGRNSCMHCDF